MGRIRGIAGAAACSSSFAPSTSLRQREGMGLGDVKLARHDGRLPRLLARRLRSLQRRHPGAPLYAVTLIARGRASATTRLPFGSFLAAGGLFAALFGAPLIDSYASLF